MQRTVFLVFSAQTKCRPGSCSKATRWQHSFWLKLCTVAKICSSVGCSCADWSLPAAEEADGPGLSHMRAIETGGQASLWGFPGASLENDFAVCKWSPSLWDGGMGCPEEEQITVTTSVLCVSLWYSSVLCFQRNEKLENPGSGIEMGRGGVLGPMKVSQIVMFLYSRKPDVEP